MKIDGKLIASRLFEDLKKRVEELIKKGIEPHLVVILVGENPASKSYVRQKEIKILEVGSKFTLHKLPESTSKEELLSLIKKLNDDSKVHGIIVQLPLPKPLTEDIALKVKPEKDIDGFDPQSPFPMPLAKAVLKILENVYKTEIEQVKGKINFGVAEMEGLPATRSRSHRETARPRRALTGGKSLTGPQAFISWMEMQKIVVVGKGKTGGGPTIEMLRKLGLNPAVIDSKTKNPKEIIKNADIIISAVGKPNMVTKDMIKKGPPSSRRGVILISVGMYKGEDNKLYADYNEEEIKDTAAFYTPVPGGVGPVNVACLIENLILAAENQTSKILRH